MVINHSIPEKDRYIQDLEADERKLRSIIDRINILQVSKYKKFIKWLESLWYELKDFIATIIAKYMKEKTN